MKTPNRDELPGATDTNQSVQATHSRPVRCPILFRAFEGLRPTAKPARWRLSDVVEVRLSRGTERARVSETPGGRKLELWLADPMVSTTQTAVRRVNGTWVIEDLGSKNGTIVNGARIKAVTLTDGDVIEIGRTFLIFRTARTLAPSDLEVAELDDLSHASPDLVTIVPELHRDFIALRGAVQAGLSILVGGQTGAGKEIVARSVVALSGRKGDFVAVNCADLATNLMESLLFGHRKGAFSGAQEDHIGFLRAADGGVLFLDEVGEMSQAAQAVLLRALETRTVTPVGGVKPIPVDLHLVSATNRPLETFVAQERFREDLYARLDGFRITLPPLRDRREDVGLIIGKLLAALAPDRAPRIRFESEAARVLFTHPYPRNIRELRRILASALAATATDDISVSHLPADVLEGAPTPPPPSARPLDPDRVEQLRECLKRNKGVVAKVAEELGKERRQVGKWIKKAGLDPNKFK